MKCQLCNLRTIDAGEKYCVQCEQAAEFVESAPANGYVSPLHPPSRFEAAAPQAVLDEDLDEAIEEIVDEVGDEEEVAEPEAAHNGSFCSDCHSAPPKSRGRCLKCYARFRYHEKKKQKNGAVAAPTPKAGRTRKAESPQADAVTFLRERAKAKYEKIIEEAQIEYGKMLEAIDRVAELSKDD